ncbi:TPA: hypothetical protein MO340_004305 [Salmonella enterica subsp. salamae serovar 35:g,m,s,t:-]|nr:hypothetical protein [Salmonella enterica subsp. salamae serovar 35:g,m,s,t:-]HCA3549775.1 hypothetical protein [Salmonella enterica subsp. salamae serovar 35:g,m,s,t:-]
MSNNTDIAALIQRLKAAADEGSFPLVSPNDCRLMLETLVTKDQQIAALETMADNAHDALSAVLESGDVQNGHVLDMIKRGLNNQPQNEFL